MIRRMGIVALVITLLLVAAGCAERAPAFDEAYSVISEPTPLLETAPPPTGEVILTIVGSIDHANIGSELQLDLPMIESVGVVEYTLDDPFEEREVTYRGVLMRDILKAAGLNEEGKMLKITALNDYAIEMPLSEFEQYPIILALQADGEYMQPDYRGPGMLVYPLHAYDTFDMNQVQDNWIWQIKSMEVL